VMSVTPIAPAEPAGDAAGPPEAGAEGSVEAPGVLHAAATTASPAVRTSTRIQMAPFLDRVIFESSSDVIAQR
jgi:hypothetical protein